MNAVALALALYVQAEVMRLGADDWATRESASRNLELLMPMVDQTMSGVAGDPERIVRARRVRETWQARQDAWYFSRALSMRTPGFKLTPWIDSFRGETDVQYWLDVANRHPARANLPNRMYEEYRLATVLWVDGELRRGVSEAELLAKFAKAAKYETGWLKGNARPNSVWEEMLWEATGESIAAPKE